MSGGESQRVKLAKFLFLKSDKKTIIILDEPTTGLHYYDIHNLITVLDNLVKKQNTLIVIEHNTDIIKNADYIIDLGPEGGIKGGNIIGKGSIKEMIEKYPNNPTSIYLKKKLEKENFFKF